MTTKILIERFCFLGSFHPVFVIKHQSIEDIIPDLSGYLESVDGESFIEIVKNCLASNALPRKDEVWYTFAAYLANSEISADSRTAVRSAFSYLAKTSDDLFLFAKYSKKIQEKNKKNGFSKTTRKAIASWYKEQEPNNLLDMWSTSTGKYGFTHNDLISMCHINCEELREDQFLTTISNKPRKLVKHNVIPTDKNCSDIMKKVSEISQFKTTGNLELATRLVNENILKFDYIPVHMLKNIELWKIILPTMTKQQLLKKLNFLYERKMLDKTAIGKTYLEELGNFNKADEQNVHPIEYLIEINKIERQKRYSENIKNYFHAKKNGTSASTQNLQFRKKLSNIFHRSFGKLETNGLRIMITINLQNNFKNKLVINQKQISCYDAAVALAYSYFHSEQSSSVYTFTEEEKLKKIHWEKNMAFFKADKNCASFMLTKNFQKLSIPITEAMEQKEIFDLFLIIVPSGTFRNKNNKPDELLESLKMYREKKNKKARMVVVNLRRFKSAMSYDDDVKKTVDYNILEICGINEFTPKLINAFALNHFN